jgi:hypothetical protein
LAAQLQYSRLARYRAGILRLVLERRGGNHALGSPGRQLPYR